MVLVTGATGLVGSHLALHLLENGESVRAIFRNPAAIEKTRFVFKSHQKENLFEKIEWIEADITDVPSLFTPFQNITSVYHCAAFISFDPKDEKLLRKTNIEGTANVVNCSLEYGVKKICYVSSIAALGDLKEHEQIITEETEWNPEAAHSDYAISKYGAEMEIWRGQQEGLQVAIVNPGVILGPHFWESGSGEIFTRVAGGLPFYTKGTTGFVTVDDVVKMLFQLMKSDVKGARFIAVAATISFEKTVGIVAKSLVVKPPYIYGKPWLTSLSWRTDWLLSTIFQTKRKLTKSMAQSLHKTNVFSNQKAKSVLNFEFSDVEDYILKIGKWYPKK